MLAGLALTVVIVVVVVVVAVVVMVVVVGRVGVYASRISATLTPRECMVGPECRMRRSKGRIQDINT